MEVCCWVYDQHLVHADCLEIVNISDETFVEMIIVLAYKVECVKPRLRPKKTWNEVIESEFKAYKFGHVCCTGS